ELDVLTNTTLADLIRRGAPHTVQPVGWGSAEQGEACAWSAAGLAAEAQGLISPRGGASPGAPPPHPDPRRPRGVPPLAEPHRGRGPSPGARPAPARPRAPRPQREPTEGDELVHLPQNPKHVKITDSSVEIDGAPFPYALQHPADGGYEFVEHVQYI